MAQGRRARRVQTPSRGIGGPVPHRTVPGGAEASDPGSGARRYPGASTGPACSRPDRARDTTRRAPEPRRRGDPGKTDLPPTSPQRRSLRPGGARALQVGGQHQAPPRGRASSGRLPAAQAARGYRACPDPPALTKVGAPGTRSSGGTSPALVCVKCPRSSVGWRNQGEHWTRKK